jgi:putative ABC transport system permease protein
LLAVWHPRGCSPALVSGGRGSHRRNAPIANRTVAGQIALALVLLANAGLLFRSFARLSSEQPGFDAANVATVRLSLPEAAYADRAALVNCYENLRRRLAAIPGIQTVGLVQLLPLAPKSQSTVPFTRPDQPPARCDDTPWANYRVVSPGYFRAMGIALVGGDPSEKKMTKIVSLLQLSA